MAVQLGLVLGVIPVSATDVGGDIAADRKPGLREVSHFKIVSCFNSAHLGSHPTRSHGIAQDIRPLSGDRECEGCDVELAVTISLGLIPAPLHPIDVTERGTTVAMHAAAEV